MTDALQLAAAIIILIAAATLATATARWAWTRFWTMISRHIATHIDRALGPDRMTALDEEMRQLVLDEHNKGDQ